jgi:hypothetical protein
VPPDFPRHPRRCAICSHPDRDAIEGDFVRWRSPSRIARDYNLPDRASVYRHAHYAGLFQRRKREVARVLESFLEAADIIIRATRLYVRINEHGDWTEAPRTQFLITGSLDPAAPPDAPAPSPRSKRSRTAAKPNPTAPKPDRRKRARKNLTATDPDSEVSQTQENK